MNKIENILVERGIVTAGEMSRALGISVSTARPLPMVVIENRMADESAVLKALADHQGLTFAELDDMPVSESAARSVPAKLASHYGILPIRLEGGVLTVAVSNPFDLSPVEDIETNLGFRVERVLACREDISKGLSRAYGVGAGTVERIFSETPARRESAAGEETHDLEKLAEDASVVRLVNQLIQEAIACRATDIHFEIRRDGAAVRRRIDGILYDATLPPHMGALYPAIVTRVKLMSGLDIVERRLPQDGRSRVQIGGKFYDLRVSVVPSIHGEDIVVRILPTSMLFDLGHLGFSEGDMAMLAELIAKPHGIVFVTGPTGSGKSTTLYACLSRINTRGRKIITIEDPVEYELKGITQTQINRNIGLTFAAALRSMLRHDPDVMMVGEVRDRETAETAVQTALTGHLVLSTLHTNDAAGGAVRLIDMGVDPYLITSTVLAFTAQRLVRVICGQCRKSEESGGKTVWRGQGCKACGMSGFFGRIAINEILPLRPEIQELILRKAPASAIRERADQLGMKTLLQDGLEKAAKGLTTEDEVRRTASL